VITTEEPADHRLSIGVLGLLTKPIQTKEVLGQALDTIKTYVSRPAKHLLIVAADPAKRDSIVELIGNGEIQTAAVDNSQDALAALRQRRPDSVVFRPEGLDITPTDFAAELGNSPGGPVPLIVFADQPLSPDEDARLQEFAKAAPVRHVSSQERLLDQTTFFLHHPVAKLSQAQQRILEKVNETEQALAGKKVLIVDDDIRNIFALTSVLEWHNMVIRSAETGREAINILQAEPDVDIVLMDIMMPEMDGFETMREIRKIARFKNLPIIAVTAKAMKGDREKCIEAGAWDYLSKPVDSDQMLAVLRAWLRR